MKYAIRHEKYLYNLCNFYTFMIFSLVWTWFLLTPNYPSQVSIVPSLVLWRVVCPVANFREY